MRHLEKQNAHYPEHLVEIAFSKLETPPPPGLCTVWRSRDYLVQVFEEKRPVLCRLSINRTIIKQGEWQQDIPWEDLQRIKSQVGYHDHDAVEVYPHDLDVVNVANMRHLWVMEDPLEFAWRRG